MRLRILSLSFKNIRGVRNLDISFKQGERKPFPISLVMMPNGTGKTTTITLLRAVLDGQAATWDSNIVREFKPAEYDPPKGEFSAKLLFDNELYNVTLILNYEKGEAYYQTSRVSTTGGGLDVGHALPPLAKDMFQKEFVKRFVFDGELAKEILSSDSDEAEKAIKYLYKVNRLGELGTRIDQIIEQIQKNAEKSNIKSKQALSGLRTQLDKIKKTLLKLKGRQKELEAEIGSKSNRINNIELQISEKIKANADLRERAEVLTNERNTNKIAINAAAQSYLEEIRIPYNLSRNVAERLNQLSGKLYNLKLPRTTSRQFFEDLAEQPTCICKRPIGKEEKEAILQQANEYLGDDQIGVINAIKQAIKDKTYNDSLENKTNDLIAKLDERQRNATDWDRLQVMLEEAGDLEIQVLNAEKVKLINQVEKLNNEYEALTTKDKEKLKRLIWEENIQLCEEEEENKKERLAEASNTVSLTNSSERVNRYLKRIETEVLKLLKEKIRNETNNKVGSIIKNDTLNIENIDGYLHLTGKKGASVGQTLAIAYSYLGAMFDNSSHELPFVVDSPAGALDLDVRREVSAILPTLFKQLIVFITSGEKEGFTDHFYRLGPDVQYLSVAKNKDADAALLEGVEEFEKFQEVASS